MRQQSTLLYFECIECGQPVRAHSSGGHTKAHFEHLQRNSKCSLSHNSELYKYSSEISSSQFEELEKIYQTIRNRSRDLKGNGNKWLREVASAKNYVATPDLIHWTFGKSAGINETYFKNGGAAKRWLYARGFRNALELSESKFKQEVISRFKSWAKDISFTDILGKFDRDQEKNSRFELLIHESVNNIEDINSRTGLDSDNTMLAGQEAYYLRKHRLNQGVFRKKIIEYWGMCCVTGISDTKFLIASHIKPWHKCTPEEKLSKYNGLLLIASYDFLFDNLFLTFSNSGKGILSESGKAISKFFGITGNIQIEKKLNADQKRFLRFHRKEFNRKHTTLQ